MRAGSIKKYFLICNLLIVALTNILPVANATQNLKKNKVVLIPFTINAQEDLSFLVKGIHDMLTTRLSWQDRVVIVDPDLVMPVSTKIFPSLNDEKACQIGKKLNAQIVIFGSITKLGKTVSIDARVIKTADNSLAMTFIQSTDLEMIIPVINDFSQRINTEIFERPNLIITSKKAQEDINQSLGQKSIEVQPTSTNTISNKPPENMNPLNPLFLRNLKNESSEHYWRSPRIDGTISSLAVADIDADGKNELLVLLPDSLRVYRLINEHFTLIREFKNGPDGNYLFVDVTDVMGTGIPQIFISNRQARSISSFVLQWQKDNLQIIASDLPYYFRVQPNPTGQGLLLLGQKAYIDDAFSGPIYEIGYKNKSFTSIRELTLPKECNIYNCALADLNGTGKPMIAVVTLNYSLRIYSSANEENWTSAQSYAATNKYIEIDARSGRGIEPIWYYLPARLVVNNLAKNGKQGIIVVRNEDRASGILEKTRMFFQGTIYSLFWNSMTMEENWHTPNINGYLTDYVLADIANVGQSALIISIGQRTGGGFFEKGTSYIMAFTL